MDYIISIITVAGNRAAGAAAVRAGENDERLNMTVGLCMWFDQLSLAVRQNQAKIPGDKMLLQNILSSPMATLLAMKKCNQF